MFVEVVYGHAEAEKKWFLIVNPAVASCALLAHIQRATKADTLTQARAWIDKLADRIAAATEKWVSLQQREASRDPDEPAPEGAADEVAAAEGEKTALEAQLAQFQDAARAFADRLNDPELTLDVQDDSGAVVGLRSLGSKYASEVLTDKTRYTLCVVSNQDGDTVSEPLTFSSAAAAQE